MGHVEISKALFVSWQRERAVRESAQEALGHGSESLHSLQQAAARVAVEAAAAEAARAEADAQAEAHHAEAQARDEAHHAALAHQEAQQHYVPHPHHLQAPLHPAAHHLQAAEHHHAQEHHPEVQPPHKESIASLTGSNGVCPSAF